MKVSLVTGGGRGIGRAIALALGGPETVVAIAGRTSAALDSSARDLRRGGTDPIRLQMDVTSESSIDRAMGVLREAAAHIDVLVNNAGVGGGRIINLSSVLGRFGVPGYTAYCASKHAVIGFTRALALELAPQQIAVNAICPGWVDTEMAEQGMRQGAAATGQTFEQFRDSALGAVPIKRIIQPEEVAALVAFLASPAAAAITGQTYNICGGQTMD